MPYSAAEAHGSPAAKILPLLVTLVGVIIAIALRIVWHRNGDVSWLLDIAERTLDGATPYRDYLEPNPPASILLYAPAVVFARLAKIQSETMTDILVFLGVAASLSLSGRILLRAELIDRRRALTLGMAGCFLLLVLPLNSFGQREHIAVLAMLPILACLAVRIDGRTPAAWAFVLAGLGAGIALSVKPVFGLALLGPIVELLRQRSWRSLRGALSPLRRAPELWIAAGLTVAYALGVAVLCPDYTSRILPLLVNIYVPARVSVLALLVSPPVWIWVPLVYTYWRVRPANDPLGLVLTMASAGFEACFFIQGKGFYYHAFPAVALAGLACAGAIRRIGPAESYSSCLPAAVAMIGGLVVFAEYSDIELESPGLIGAMAAVSPHPSLISVGGDANYGRALARELGGTWVSSTPMAWITYCAEAITRSAEQDSRFASSIDMERQLFADDIDTRRPDIVLIESERWMQWTQRSPALVQALSHYRSAGTFGETYLFARLKSSLAVTDLPVDQVHAGTTARRADEAVP